MDWTHVTDHLIDAVAPMATVVLAWWNIRRHIKPPSGGTIGEMVEKTHDLSSADLLATTEVYRHLKDGDRRREERRRESGQPLEGD